MMGISFTKILEFAPDDGQKNLTGQLRDLQSLLENAERLQNIQSVAYSFIAFHPAIDRAVTDYLAAGSVSSDSGRDVLVLFFANNDFELPREVEQSDLDVGLHLDPSVHPAYEVVQRLFPHKPVEIPGIVFFDRFINTRHAVYVPLQNADTPLKVRQICQKLFHLASDAFKSSPNADFIERLRVLLAGKAVPYKATDQMCFKEWLLQSYNFLLEHGAIVSVIKDLGSLGGSLS
jgi:hypothetical protein